MTRWCFVFAAMISLQGRSWAEDPQPKPVEAPQPKPAEKLSWDSPIQAKHVRPHIEFLAGEKLKGRSGAGGRLAAEYIRERFQEAKLAPLFDGESYFQEIPGRADENGEKPVLGRNVGGWIEGSDPKLRDEFVIISAHYDHLGVRNGKMYPGADDNASGVSMMLELARRLSASTTKPKRSIAFVGFDLEERFLWGSRWFAAHPPWPMEQVKLFITADMIGRSLGNLPLPIVFVMGSEHSPQLVSTLDRVGSPNGLEIARLGIALIGTRSDYGPFRDRKVPFLFFSTGEHPDYHSPRDLPDRIDYDKVARISSLALKIVTDVADADEAPEWIDTPRPSLNEARTLNRIAKTVLDPESNHPLTSLQRLIVTQARIKTDQIIKRGTITDSERTWLTRLAQLMLLSIF
jgi:hypothetical protein